MAPEGFTRKLTAILNADVEGYSRLMREDEETTIRTLTTFREAMATLIHKHRGRVVDAPGDNLLAEFASVVDAVQCAVEIQRELAERNAELPAENKMAFRIGVNLGDVVEEDGRIYGDGVNIAARLESICEGGGICISGTAFEHIEHKLDLEYENLGEHEVKNITKPVRVYQVLSYPGAAAHRVVKAKRAIQRKWRKAALALAALLVIGAGTLAMWIFFLRPAPPTVEPASTDKMAFPLPDKPSIAVLPFDNLSGDPEQEYFSDGITEDLITDLSKISGLFIIARNSTFAYKGKPVKIRQVAEELGVRYVLEGSVRKAQKQVRINAQLIDATTGHHLWADRYDGKLEDIFALQDRITQKIVSALKVKLIGEEQKQVVRKETDNVAAYDAYLKGWGHYIRFTPDDFAEALSYFKKAIGLDPNYWRAYAALAKTYWNGSRLGFQRAMDVSWAEARMRTREYLQIAMENPTSLAYTAASEIYLTQRLHEKAIAEAERAIALDPNEADNHAMMAKVLIFAGRQEEALDFVENAMRLDPHNIAYPLYLRGLALFAMRQLDESVTSIERALTHNPEIRREAGVLAVAYAHLGRDQKAQDALNNYKTGIDSSWHLLYQVMYHWPFKDLQVAERFADGLLKAGLPGKPSGYYKISDEHKLSGEEIRDLFFGRTVRSFYRWHREHLERRTKDGKATWRIAPTDRYGQDDSGSSWIENDMLCNQWQMNTFGIKHCMTIFRNPEGTPDMNNEYVGIPDFGFVIYSPVD